MAETSTKPYLIRAIYEWCNDNGFTPYLAVAVDERTQVPREYVKAGEIVLNVSPMATQRLSMGNDLITFQARFGGIARELSIPVENVSAIYARENGHGMAFDVPKALAVDEPSGTTPADAAPADPAPPVPPQMSLVPDAQAPQAPSGDAPGEGPGTDGAPPRGGRPRLTRIK
jgi:stringent starvation protein B